MSSRLKRRFGESKHRGVVPNTQGSTNKKVFCPLCRRTQDIQMKYDDIKQVWICPFCGHSSDPKLSQIALSTSSTSQLKASNDIYDIKNRQKVFFGNGERRHRRIDTFPNQTTSYQKSKVYPSLAQAEQATNIHQDPDELD
jgi:ribosomal protein L37AE/L43A